MAVARSISTRTTADGGEAMTKITRAAKGTRRREFLRAYLITAVEDSEIQWLDFMVPSTLVEKTLGLISRDIKFVAADLGKRGAEGLLHKGAELLGMMVNIKRSSK